MCLVHWSPHECRRRTKHSQRSRAMRRSIWNLGIPGPTPKVLAVHLCLIDRSSANLGSLSKNSDTNQSFHSSTSTRHRSTPDPRSGNGGTSQRLPHHAQPSVRYKQAAGKQHRPGNCSPDGLRKPDDNAGKGAATPPTRAGHLAVYNQGRAQGETVRGAREYCTGQQPQ